MVEERGLGTVGMNYCQYFMSLAALLGPNLKTSDMRLSGVYYVTTLWCRDASVKKGKEMRKG